MAIVDSSIFVKYFAKEPGWEEAAGHLMQPVSIELSLAEVANALSKKISAGELEHADAELFLRKMMVITRLLAHGDVVVPALKIAVEKRVTVYDALFIAAALKNKAALATSDSRQASAARELGVSVEFL